MSRFARTGLLLSIAMALLAFGLFEGTALGVSGSARPGAVPRISITPKTGPPTTRITVTGAGFAADETVDVYFDVTHEARITTDANGHFAGAKFRAPRSAAPGRHWVTAVGRQSGLAAQEPFLVQTDWSQFGFSPNGARHNPYENVLGPDNVSNLTLRWKVRTGSPIDSSPAEANGVVYVSSYLGTLYALDASTGRRLWSFDTGGGNPGSPAVAAGLVYIESSDLYALDASSGAEVWSFASPTSDPTVASGVVYVGSTDDHLYALDAATGAVVWSFATGGDGTVRSQVVADGVVYAVSSGGEVFAVDASSGQELWTSSSPLASSGFVSVAKGIVYVGDGGDLYALNATTGVELWSYELDQPVTAAPAVAKGMVYVESYCCGLWALDASTGAFLWYFQIGDRTFSSPAVANGVVYLGNDNSYVYALDASTGQELWGFATGRDVVSSPAVANGVVYVGSEDHDLYAFGLSRRMEPGPATRPDPTRLRPEGVTR